MFSFRELARYLRVLRVRAVSDPISDEYRGWSWYREPVKPPGYRGLALSDIAYLYCQSMRNVYLKYVLKVEPQVTRPLFEGFVLHNVLYRVVEDIRKHIYENVDISRLAKLLENVKDVVEDIIENSLSIKNVEIDSDYKRELMLKAESLYIHLAMYYVGEISHVSTEIVDLRPDALISKAIPQFSQFHVDGYLVGLSRRLVVDAVLSNVIVEFKFGNSVNTDSVSTALAGYAIAIESDYEIPIDFGIVSKIWFIKIKEGKYVPRFNIIPVYLSNELRYRFLSLRDEAYDIIYSEKDPGKSKYCSETCPYYHICVGDSS